MKQCIAGRIALFLVHFLVLPACVAVGEERSARTDQYGDPLPDGAVARMGSVRLRWPSPVSELAFSPDSRSLSVIVHETKKSLWNVDVATGKTTRRWSLPNLGYADFAATPDDRFVAVRTSGGEVRVFEAKTGKPVWQTSIKRRYSALALSPDGKTLAAGETYIADKSHEIHLWHTATGRRLAVLRGHRTTVTALAFTSDGKKLLSAGEDYRRAPIGKDVEGTVCAWEMPSRKLLRRFPQPGKANVFSPDGRTLAYLDEERRIRLLDVDSGKELAVVGVKGATYRFLPDGRLVTGGDEQMLQLWDVTTGRRVRKFKGYLGNGTYPAAVSPDGKVLATISHYTAGDYSVRLWDAVKGIELRPFGGHLNTVTCLDFSPDGKRLVSGGKDHTVRLWETATGKELRLLGRHPALITFVAFSPDGRRVASGDDAGNVRVWDAAAGKLLHRIKSRLASRKDESPRVTTLQFANDGKTLFVGSKHAQVVDLDVRVQGELAAWDPVTGKAMKAEKLEGSAPIALSRDGTLSAWAELVSAGILAQTEDLHVRRRDTDREVFVLTGDKNERFERVTFAPDAKTLAVHSSVLSPSIFGGRSTPRFRLIDVPGGRTILRVDKDFTRALFTPQGRVLVAARDKDYGALRLVSPKTGKTAARLAGHLSLIHPCVISGDGKLAATGSADHTILVWDLTRRR